MNFSDYENAKDYEVFEWIDKEFNLTTDQKNKIFQNDVVRMAPFKFFKRKKKVKNPLIRITIIFFPIVFAILFIGLPFNFILSGQWGYGDLSWYRNWLWNLGIGV